MRVANRIRAAAAVALLLSGCQHSSTSSVSAPTPSADFPVEQQMAVRRVRLSGTAITEQGPARVRIDGQEIAVADGRWVYEVAVPPEGRLFELQLLAGDAIVDVRVLDLRRE